MSNNNQFIKKSSSNKTKINNHLYQFNKKFNPHLNNNKFNPHLNNNVYPKENKLKIDGKKK